MRSPGRHSVPHAYPRHVEIRLRRGPVPRPGSQGRIANSEQRLAVRGLRADLGLDLARDHLPAGPGAAGGVGGVSVTLAAAILLVYCGVRALPLRYTVRDH